MNKFLLLFYCIRVNSFAQDSVIKRDGSELKVKITEITDTQLKYQKDGLSVAFSLDLSEVLLVTFENGERMTFDNVKKSSAGV